MGGSLSRIGAITGEMMDDDLPATIGKLLAVLGLVAANGFFVAAEFSLVGVRRSRGEELVTQGRVVGCRIDGPVFLPSDAVAVVLVQLERQIGCPGSGKNLPTSARAAAPTARSMQHAGAVSFVAKGAEVASAGVAGKGGMPGGMLAVSSNGEQPDTGIVWALAPLSGDANKHVVEGILRAYDATKLDPVPNADGTPRLKLLWDSRHIPNNRFSHCKFCPSVIASDRVFVPTYDGRVDAYGLVGRTHAGPVPTNGGKQGVGA